MHDTTNAIEHNPSAPEIQEKKTAPVRPHIARRRYVVDARQQYKSAALICGLALFLLVTFNIAFAVMRSSQSMVLSTAAPQLRPILEERDARTGTMLMIASVIFIGGVFVITIVETHRTLGAVVAIKRHLGRVRDGDYRSELRLREGDTLRGLIDPFNEMLSSLRLRATGDADELDRLADEAGEDPELAEALRVFAQRKRDLAA
jgi:methyl-accepting chemotaxis protein